jgi:hypothetical protein
MSSSPFTFINSINAKDDLTKTTEGTKLVEKEYSPWLTNRAFSLYEDTIHYANAMNQHHGLESIMQYQFFINIVKKRKRYSKWFKYKAEAEVEAISEYYQCSLKRAKEIVSVLTDDQRKEIIKRIEKGG